MSECVFMITLITSWLWKMSQHRIQWLLACNLLSYFVCSFKNVDKGCIHADNANYGWGCTVIIMHLCLASYLSLFSISFLFCMGIATIQLRLRTWFGVLASCAWHSQASSCSAVYGADGPSWPLRWKCCRKAFWFWEVPFWCCLPSLYSCTKL